MTDIKVTVNGVLGKMGQEVLRAVTMSEGIQPVNGVDIAAGDENISLPDNTSTIPLFKDVSKAIVGSDVVIDFTNSEGARSVINAAATNGVSCVIGSTGLSDNDFKIHESDSEALLMFPARSVSKESVSKYHPSLYRGPGNSAAALLQRRCRAAARV